MPLRTFGKMILFVIILMAAYSNGSSASVDWLIGYWEGTVSGGSTSDHGTREFRVRTVSTDGTFSALWAIKNNLASNLSGKSENGSVVLTFLNGPAKGTVIILARPQDGLLIGTGNPVNKPANQVVLHRKSSKWNVTSLSSGCDFQLYSDRRANFGQPLGIKHLAEGETTFEVGTHDAAICKDGVFQRILATSLSKIEARNWLVGYWEGTVKGPSVNLAHEELRIQSIRPDGSFNALWGAHGFVASNVVGELEDRAVKLRLINGPGIGGVANLTLAQRDLLIGAGSQPGGLASQIELHKQSQNWNYSTVQGSGCDYESFTSSGRAEGQKHLGEGAITHEVRTGNSLICQDGVFQRVLK